MACQFVGARVGHPVIRVNPIEAVAAVMEAVEPLVGDVAVFVAPNFDQSILVGGFVRCVVNGGQFEFSHALRRFMTECA